MRLSAQSVELSHEKDLACNEVTIRISASRRAKMRSELEALKRQGHTIRWQEEKHWFFSWFAMIGPYFLIDHVILQLYPERLEEACEASERGSKTQILKAA